MVANFAGVLGVVNGVLSKSTYKKKRTQVEATLKHIVANMTGLGQDQVPVAFVDHGDGNAPDPDNPDYDDDEDEGGAVNYKNDLAKFKASLVGKNKLLDGSISLVNLFSACTGQLAPGSIEHRLLIAVGQRRAQSVPPKETAFVYHKVNHMLYGSPCVRVTPAAQLV